MKTPIMSVATSAAEAAADVLRTYHAEGVQMRTKSTSVDLVSDADVNAERAIVSVIESAFPDHSILGEEESSGDINATDLWIVDPLDGTTNFAHGIPHFAVSVAHYHQGKATAGIVLNPITGDVFAAEAGQGATHNGQPIAVSQSTSLGDELIGCGFYYDRGEMMQATLSAIERLFQQQIHGIRRFGTASLDLSMVACGRVGAFFEYQLSPWDFAAGRLILEEAGGRITTTSGDPLPLAVSTVLASNGHLHEAMLNLVRR